MKNDQSEPKQMSFVNLDLNLFKHEMMQMSDMSALFFSYKKRILH